MLVAFVATLTTASIPYKGVASNSGNAKIYSSWSSPDPQIAFKGVIKGSSRSRKGVRGCQMCRSRSPALREIRLFRADTALRILLHPAAPHSKYLQCKLYWCSCFDRMDGLTAFQGYLLVRMPLGRTVSDDVDAYKLRHTLCPTYRFLFPPPYLSTAHGRFSQDEVLHSLRHDNRSG